MSKVASRLRGMRKAVRTVVHPPLLRLIIGAQQAANGPPLGPQLGQRGVNISAFCKDFNDRTAAMRAGAPLPCRITVRSDRSYELVIHHPTTSFLLMQAAGITRGAMRSGSEVVGKITRKHVYEIARIKSEDPPLQEIELPDICKMIIRTSTHMGIQVVDHIDPVEYGEFLERRREINAAERAELDEAREAKMLKGKL